MQIDFNLLLLKLCLLLPKNAHLKHTIQIVLKYNILQPLALEISLIHLLCVEEETGKEASFLIE